jgi:hypothetical protein
MMKSQQSYQPVQLNEHVNNDDLEQSLIGAPPPSAVLEGAHTSILMEVTAPASLPEGYEFFVAVNRNQKIPVTVPAGGVEQGQKFHVPMPPGVNDGAAAAPTDNVFPSISIPVGHWRDDIVGGILNYGPCHPHIWTAVGCTMRELPS